MESIHVNFDELPQMASDQNSSDPAPECQTMTSDQNSSDPAPECQTMASDQLSSDPALECHTIALNHDSLSPAIQRQGKVTQADWTVTTSPVVDDPAVQSLLDLRKGSKASRLESLKQKKQPVAGKGSSVVHTKYYDNSKTDSDAILYSSCSNTLEESANETDNSDESNMHLTNDNPVRDDDVARYRVFMYNKTTQTPNSTYISLMITSSCLDFIQTLLNETPINELTYLMSHPVYIDAHTTSVVHNLEGNPEKMFSDEVKKNMRKINFKKEIAQKFRDYDQKQEALTNFNVSEAFKKVVQARVLTEIKKLLPTHIPKAIANYARPRLNTCVLEVMQNNQISLFTKSSTSVDDLLNMKLKLKLLNRTYENKTHPKIKSFMIRLMIPSSLIRSTRCSRS
uniref:Uncharacterized protein n=1 Tax=Tanacetum cinerariifolium TaxID=118510 RepID=A0A6L2LCX0_TANCI|nr:hypothetical protein [Tanacetum cinerariifolium]